MLTVPSVHIVNWLRVYIEFSIPSFVRILYRSLVRSVSIITPKMFLESHLPQSTSGTQNFSLASLVILNACISKLLFTVFLFSVILLLRLTHIDGERATCVTIYVDRRSSAHFSSWTSTNTGPSIFALSTKLLLVPFGVST